MSTDPAPITVGFYRLRGKIHSDVADGIGPGTLLAVFRADPQNTVWIGVQTPDGRQVTMTTDDLTRARPHRVENP